MYTANYLVEVEVVCCEIICMITAEDFHTISNHTALLKKQRVCNVSGVHSQSSQSSQYNHDVHKTHPLF